MTTESPKKIESNTSAEIEQPTSFPFYVTPEQFAAHFGWSPREVRRKAREIGACRILGNAMIFIQADIDALLEATRPKPKKPPAVRQNSPGDALQEARLKLRKLKEQHATRSKAGSR